MLGDGNFTSEIQVELDMDEVTSARESYDKDGVVRSETQQQSQQAGSGQAAACPACCPTPRPRLPRPSRARRKARSPAAPGATPPTNGESSSARTYELGREVAVSNSQPGRSSAAFRRGRDQRRRHEGRQGHRTYQDLEALVSAAVGADPQRGDQVKVVTRSFEQQRRAMRRALL